MNPQPDLFDAGPPGFAYRPQVLSVAEEAALADWLSGLDFAPFEFRGVKARRQVISFGWRYESGRTSLSPADALPVELEGVRAKAADLAGLDPDRLQQVLINKYEPGAPIGWHRDRPIFGKVVAISLLAPCDLRFRRRREEGFERYGRLIEPRSAYMLSGPARDEWEHSIPPAEALRYSITYRDFR